MSQTSASRFLAIFSSSLALAACGTQAERDALRNLEPLPLPFDVPAMMTPAAEREARELEALRTLQPLPNDA